MIAFVAFSAIASSIYLFNDILDIHHDRRHARKRHRPVAAGLVTIPEALVAAVVLTLTGFALSLALLPLSFVGVLAAYQVITLGYTLFLKELVLLDVLTLGVLYTLRVVAGAATLLLPLTPWLLAFSMFTFVSLAIVKRYAELSALFNQESEQPLAGRGYFQADLPLLLSLGTSSAYASVLVLALYIQDSGTRTLYENPILMWLAVPAWLYWFHRVWLLTHRKEIHDDPVVFAIKDPMTYVVGSIIAAVFYAAI
jgi:4-hydroxybenzoate polyprenyltransferase